jgi:hypothetical protein|tara:strand:+ start:261 stop:659 length:399 start_codon:yes stop_codon:yes gene_type:complete
MSKEHAYPQAFYDYTLNRITDYNNQTEEERSALDPIKWYGTFKTQLAEIDRKSYGKSVPRDEKKLAPFITRIKTQIVNDIATTGNLSKEEKKKVSKMIALPSRSSTAAMLRNANANPGYADYAKQLIANAKS